MANKDIRDSDHMTNDIVRRYVEVSGSVVVPGVGMFSGDGAGGWIPYVAPSSSSGGLTDTQLRATPVPISVSNASIAVTGTFWQTTQPVSGTFWPATQPVSGTFWQATQPVSGPLTDTQLRAVAVPVSGTITVANPTTNPETGLAKDATLTGGTAKAIARTAAKGTTTAADLTSEATDANTQSLHIRVTNTAIAVTGTFWQATQPVSGTVTSNQGTAAALASAWPIKISDGTNTVGIYGGTAAGNEATVDRMKVSAELRLLDTAAAVGSQLVAAKGDQTTGLWVNVKNGTIAVTGTFWQATQPVSGTFWQATQPVSGTVTAAQATAANLLATVTQGPAAAASAAWMAKVTDGTNVGAVKAASAVAVATDPAQVTQQTPQRADASTLWVTGTAAVNTGVTLNLPAPAAGLFHYITSIQIVKLYSVVGVAAGAGVIITSTNLPGTPNWTTEQLASAAGTAVTVVNVTPTTPVKSSVAATATTIVAPAQLQTIWRINVSYYTAP